MVACADIAIMKPPFKKADYLKIKISNTY